jgi:hypothetical protein
MSSRRCRSLIKTQTWGSFVIFFLDRLANLTGRLGCPLPSPIKIVFHLKETKSFCIKKSKYTGNHVCLETNLDMFIRFRSMCANAFAFSIGNHGPGNIKTIKYSINSRQIISNKTIFLKLEKKSI